MINTAITPETYRNWRKIGYLTENACKQYFTGEGCPHGFSVTKNEIDTELCQGCTDRKN